MSYYVLDVLRLISFLILTPYLLAYLGDERFGIQLTVVALMGYMGLLDLGLSSVLPKYIAEERGRGDDAKITRLVASGFWTFVLTGFFGFMLTCLATQHVDFLFRDLMPRFQDEAAWFLVLMGLNFMFSLPLGILAGVPYAYERIELMNLIKILQILIWPAAILVTIHWDLGLQGLALGSIAATLAGGIGNLWLSFWLKPDLSLAPRQASVADIRKLFSYGLLFFINGISVVLVFKTDSVVISIGLGAGMVTLYAIIADVSQQISMFIFKIGDALFPTYSRLNAAGQHLLLARTFITSLRYTVIIAGLVASFFIVFGVDIFTLWLGRPGEIPVWVVSIFGLIILLHSISHVSGMFVAAMGHLGRIVWWSVVEGGLNLGLSLMMIAHLGVTGVALATLMAQLLTTAWIYPLVARRVLSEASTGEFVKALLYPLIASVLAFFLLWTLRDVVLIGQGEWSRLLTGLGVTLVMVATGVYYGRRRQMRERAFREGDQE